MAYEIWHSYDSASVLYAFVYRNVDNWIYDVAAGAMAAIGVWNDARAIACAIPMAAVGDMHFGTFPTVAAGTYVVEIRLRATGAADTDDIPVAQGVMYWNGTAEITPTILDDLIDTAQADLDTITGATGVLIDDNAITDDALATSAVTEIFNALSGVTGYTIEDLYDALVLLGIDANKVLNVFPWEEPKPEDKRRVET